MGQKQQKKWIQYAVLSSIFSLSLVFLLNLTSLWQQLENYAFDSLSIVVAPKITETDIVIVTIDEQSFEHFQTQWPWPRKFHSDLLARLNSAGAKVIFFDLIFDLPSSFGAFDDVQFAEAIMASDVPVYLAKYAKTEVISEGVLQSQVLPLPLYLQAGANAKAIGLNYDLDGVVRAVPNENSSLWYAFDSEPSDLEKRIHYIGDANSFPKVSYYRAADIKLLPNSVFKDKIVLVGLDILANAELGLHTDDRFLTPYTWLNGKTMAGVEVHANLIENIRHDLTLSTLLPWQVMILTLFIALVASYLFTGFTIKKSVLGLIKLIALVLALSLVSFYFQVHLPTVSLIAVALTCYLFYFAISFRSEQKQRRFISDAFSRYVSENVLNELMDEPDKLELGGERKNLTILFADLAGFTKLSEQLGAEQVADILHEILTAHSEIIVKHGGTIDKYLGDAVMAFWGAPVADENQIENAVAAALEMNAECAKLTDKLNQRGSTAVKLRIGINFGEAIVGHLGSEVLFDYTCIGDSVNQAARLESANRLYGTDVLISESVFSALQNNDSFVLVDKVILKGKSETTRVYGYFPNTLLTDKLNLAFSAFCSQDWQCAKQLYNELKESDEFKILAELFLQRISHNELSMLSDDWQGETHLKNK
ncbi:CHASE2 domain-containing protein [Pseudoalteromonas sp.]|uniref:CHASE2 domain-containing protein n=1 Tax=Pseudoalteromonas sp. TaxID=53249 RepID=UPI0035643B1B